MKAAAFQKIQGCQIITPQNAIDLCKTFIGNPTALIKVRKHLIFPSSLKKDGCFLQIANCLLQISPARKKNAFFRIEFGKMRKFCLCTIHKITHQVQGKAKGSHGFQCNMIKAPAGISWIRREFQPRKCHLQTAFVLSKVVETIRKSGVKSLRMTILLNVLEHQGQVAFDFFLNYAATIAVMIEYESFGIGNSQTAFAAVYIFMNLSMIAQPWCIAKYAQTSVT